MDFDDPELISDFVAEAEERVDEIEALLLDLEGGKGELKDAIGGFHTLKGMTGYIDFAELQQLCHQTESVLQAASVRREDRVDIALQVVGVLRQRLEDLSDCAGSGESLPESPQAREMLRQLGALLQPRKVSRSGR